jgi:hypothetical protein
VQNAGSTSDDDDDDDAIDVYPARIAIEDMYKPGNVVILLSHTPHAPLQYV